MDVVFINPSIENNYQSLGKTYAAIEPPTWSLLLAQSMRSFGYKVSIIDINAEKISQEQVYDRIIKIKPRLIAMVVYGQNVNAGTTNMEGALNLSKFLKNKNKEFKIAYFGSHVQAMPREILRKENSVDIVFTNEGVYALKNLLKLKIFDSQNLLNIKGIGFKDTSKIILNPTEKLVPNELMDKDLPGYAWDLLPYKKKPFDLYRSPMWHAEYDEEKRTPYAAIQTSLGCQFKCSFCMINILNRNDLEEIGVSSNYSGMRFWSPEFIFNEFKKLINYGVETIRIVDEMFLLNPKYYLPLCKKLTELNTEKNLRMWAYSRVDTVKNPDVLKIVKAAGIKWLALGIESGNKKVRLEVTKGKFEDVDVKNIVKQVHDAGIEVMANYIYGLPGDTEETIEETLKLSLELCTSGWNTYAAMALPGSLLYKEALQKGYDLPETYSGYSFHGYDTVCLPTEKLKNWEVLKLRDEAFIKYHTNKNFLDRIEQKFGIIQKNNIIKMTKTKLKRKIIEKNS